MIIRLEKWNGRKWPACLERGHRAENFDGHIAYTRMDGYGVIKDLISWTSDAMDDSLWRLWRLLQCLDGDWTLTCCSKLLQFRRCESRGYVSVCVCLCVMCRVRMCICWTGMCMSCSSYQTDWVPTIRDIHHGLLSLLDPLHGTRSDDEPWTYMYSLYILYHGQAVVTMINQL